jgi:chorismate dehydratase
MKQPVRISIVSYLNSRPFLYGLRHSGLAEEIDLQLDIPSVCATKLLEGRVNIGLVPVAILPLLQDYRIIGEYCIGASGPVRSVLLVSDVPLDKIRTVMLDYQSRTSVTLVKVLAEELWKIRPAWVQAEPGFEEQVSGDRAAVIIGDRAFKAANEHRYVYDLAEAWTDLTGKPFVFAVWAGRPGIDPEFIRRFNEALKAGLNSLDAVVSAETDSVLTPETLRSYLSQSIRFAFDEPARQGLAAFLERLKG